MNRNNSPPDLAAQLRAGDEAVLEAILRTHGPPVMALLMQRFPGQLRPGDLEDVLAAALFRVWQHRARFDAERASLRVWFFRIAENQAHDVLRLGWHKSSQLELGLDPNLLTTTIDQRPATVIRPQACPNDVPAALRIPPDQLRALLDQLPENQRRIVLADADSPDGVVPSQSLAEELGISQSAVRVYRRRALERLRREIEQREQEEVIP